MKWLVRFDDVYLMRLSEDHEPIPEWGPREEACVFEEPHSAHLAKQAAKDFHGKHTEIVVVRVRKRRERAKP